MTEPTAPARPRRYLHNRAEYRWTGPKAAAFLRALAASGSVTQAARSVGMSRQSAYDLRGRLSARHGPAFGRLWDEAMAIAVTRRCAEMIDRLRADKTGAGLTPAPMTPAIPPLVARQRAR